MTLGAPGRPVILSLTLLAATAVSLTTIPGPDAIFGALLAALMLAIAVTDSGRYIIPNELTAAAAALALLRAGLIGFEPGWWNVLCAAFRAAAVALPFLALMAGYRRWRGRDGLGMGDVKLAAVAGAWLDWITVFAVIEIATLTALGAYLAMGYLRKRPPRGTAFLPFGAFLAPAIWIGWLVSRLP